MNFTDGEYKNYYNDVQCIGPIKLSENEKIWHCLSCYYYAQTELFDRSLTDTRSPYDPTEAYITNPRLKSLSNENARKIRAEITKEARFHWWLPPELTARIGLEQYARFSAQSYIDEFKALYERGEMDFLGDNATKVYNQIP